MPEDAFQTARFEIHNPSRHKQAMLLSAMRSYHQMAKEILESALAGPIALQQNCLGRPNAKGQSQPNGFVTSKYVRTLTRKGWNLAPLRDYVLADVTAALMSYLQKNHKGKNKANPPTLPALQAISEEQYRQSYQDVLLQTVFAPKPEHQEKIDEERAAGHPRVAHRLERIFTARAATKALSQLLRSTEGPLPRNNIASHSGSCCGPFFHGELERNQSGCISKPQRPSRRDHQGAATFRKLKRPQ